MNLKDKIEKFNRRWNIDPKESPEESFNKFKTRILNIFNDIDQHVTEASISEFCQFYGIQEVWEYNYAGTTKWGQNIVHHLVQENIPVEFYKLLEVIFALQITSEYGYSHDIKYSKEILLRETSKAINYSNVGLDMQIKDGEVIFYPKGEELLDDELVNIPLSFLNTKSSEHFIDALRFYQDKKPIKSAESLRRTLEEFLREKLTNQKGLDANITELQKKIKTDGRDAQIRNIINSIFTYLDQYFNSNSKHNDGDIDEVENEFLIYQTGLLMRYINKNI
ncbi:MAG: hypothetical protein WCY48_07900 [Candidatus Caldatribacteriota bacterium]